MSISDDVAIQLQIKGVQEGEAQRLAGMTSRALEEELRASLRIQQSAYAASMAAISDMEKKSASQTISQARTNTKEIQTAYQLQERAASHASQVAIESIAKEQEAHHRRIENFKNVAETSFLAYEAINHVGESFKELAESIAKTQNIYGSLKGSIDGMREASGGQIADIDLITTKNRAFQKDLALTDDQFGQVSAAAMVFSHALGTDTKEALDKIIDGLATGRTRALAMAGVIVDEKQAYQEYANKIGVATDKLSEHDQKVAKVEASLRAMDKKLIESGGEVKNFASEWEKANAQMSNLADTMKLGMGSVITWLTEKFDAFTDGFAKSILELELNAAKAADWADKAIHPFSHKTDHAGAVADAQQRLDAFKSMLEEQSKAEQKEAQKQVEAAKDRQRRDTNPRMSDLKMFGGSGLAYDAEGAVGGDRTPGKGAKAGKSYDLKDDYEKMSGQRRAAEKALAESMLRDAIASFGFDPDDPKAAESAMGDPDKLAAGMGWIKSSKTVPSMFAGYSTEETTDAEGKKHGSEVDDFTKAQGHGVLTQDQQDKIAEQYKALGRSLTTDSDGHEHAGAPGLIEKMLFGDTGAPDVLYDKMTEAQKITFDATQDMQKQFESFGNGMAGALGKSFAASLGENKNFIAGLKNATHEVLMSLAEQAATKAAFETALGLAALAGVVTAGDAAPHFVAAAAFGGVALAAGVAARATYSGGGSAASSTPTSTRAGGTSSTGSSSSSSTSNDPQPVTIIVNGSIFSNKEELVKAVSAAAVEHFQINGKPAPGFV